jgi:hypothetical protein
MDLPELQFGIPFWVKVYTTEFDTPHALEDLVANNPKIQQTKGEAEIEWQRLQTDPGNPDVGKIENGGLAAVDQQAESVVRRCD